MVPSFSVKDAFAHQRRRFDGAANSPSPGFSSLRTNRSRRFVLRNRVEQSFPSVANKQGKTECLRPGAQTFVF